MLKCSAAIAALSIGAVCSPASSVNSYVQANLTSDLPGIAAHQDPNLANPWGIVAGAGGPFWVSDNRTGLSTLYNGSGTPLPLVVTVPPAAGTTGPGSPTGIVFNSSAGFGGSHFIFDSEDGTISAWASGTSAVLQATSPAGSVYKGLAIGGNGSGGLLYASNFGLGRVDVFDANFKPTTVAGGFKDSTIPAGYAPFDIQAINGSLYVTYAQQDSAKHDDVSGAGHGFVDVFDMNGNLVKRLASQGALNSPWGLAMGSSHFGGLAGDLLVGNFGDGRINAYDPSSGAFVGTVNGPDGSPIVLPGLWGLNFGNGAFGQNVDSLYFTAGIPGPGSVEDHGLFGSLTAATPEPTSGMLVGASALGGLCLSAFRRRRKLQSRQVASSS